MTRVLAIDPGNTESAFVVIDQVTHQPLRFGKIPNHELLDLILAANFYDCEHIAIEMIASYGMAVGADVFETCVWVGRFYQLITLRREGQVQTVKRHPVKLHHCHSAKAKDSNITQALVDRFTPGASNFGKGTKANPGWFYGFSKDVWQAYALAVYVADTLTPDPAPADSPHAAGAVPKAATAPNPPSPGAVAVPDPVAAPAAGAATVQGALL